MGKKKRRKSQRRVPSEIPVAALPARAVRVRKLRDLAATLRWTADQLCELADDLSGP
jgi:hypothetical protein